MLAKHSQLVWDWIKCKESDRLPPEGHGAGTLQDISVRCTSVFFSTMIVANSYSVLMNPQMQHFAARGLLPGMTGEADWTAGCSWEATHCDAHFWSASVVGGYMLYGAPAGPPHPASALARGRGGSVRCKRHTNDGGPLIRTRGGTQSSVQILSLIHI